MTDCVPHPERSVAVRPSVSRDREMETLDGMENPLEQNSKQSLTRKIIKITPEKAQRKN